MRTKMNKKTILLLSISLFISGIVQAGVVFPGGTGVAPAVTQKAGDVDTGFATNGFYTSSPGTLIRSIQVQSDGKIVIAGYKNGDDWYVGRLINDTDPLTLVGALSEFLGLLI